MADRALTLALDQGTHSTRAVVFDAGGETVALARRPVALHRHDRQRVEQSATEILDSLQAVLDEVFKAPGIDVRHIQAAGLATQRSSVLAWERDSGRALSPVLSWQDTRTTDAMESLAAHRDDVHRRTGLRLSPHYGAGKLHWLLHHQADVSAALSDGTLVAGPLAGWLLHHLLQGRPDVVDHANASRTLLWNLGSRDWDGQLCRLFGIPPEILPACRPIRSEYGRLAGRQVPVTAVNGDQTAALYACGMPAPDVIRVNLGTGAFVLRPTGTRCELHDRLLTGLSSSDDGSGNYYLEGTVNGAGAALQWLERRFDITNWEKRLPAWLDTVQSPTIFLNTIGGLGSPWWRPGPEPVFLAGGECVSPGPAEAVVAAVESIVFLVQANIELLSAALPGDVRIRVSGGLAHVDGLCRKLADLSEMTVERGSDVEATARGIAWLAAGCPPGWQQGDDVTTFQPRPNDGLRQRYARFLGAISA